QLTVRIVGEAFNPENRGLQILTDLGTLTAAEPQLRPSTYNIVLKPGTDNGGYIEALNTALASTATGSLSQAIAEAAETEIEPFIVIINALTALLTLLLITVAALGVLNM